jgi:hypothetical protein
MAYADIMKELVAFWCGPLDDDEYNRGLEDGPRLEASARERHLQATVDRLPKTADGVPVVPGMNVFYLDDEEVCSAGPIMLDLPKWLAVGDCYSTQAAAEAAGGKT